MGEGRYQKSVPTAKCNYYDKTTTFYEYSIIIKPSILRNLLLSSLLPFISRYLLIKVYNNNKKSCYLRGCRPILGSGDTDPRRVTQLVPNLDPLTSLGSNK